MSIESVPVKRCKPGESYFNGCNMCFCDGSGSISCHRKLCPDNPKHISPPAGFWQSNDQHTANSKAPSQSLQYTCQLFAIVLLCVYRHLN